MYERTILNQIKNSIQHFPVTILSGPRQVGKSTELYNNIRPLGYTYITLDNRAELMTAKNDPELFLRNHPAPLIIDECQRAKDLFPALEEAVSRVRLEKGSQAANGMYVLSGSSSKALLENAKESLAGRANILKMNPLSMREIHGFSDVPFDVRKDLSITRAEDFSITEKNLLEYIVRGMMPQLYDDPETPRDQFFSDYIEAYMQKDLPEVLDVKDDLKFENFLMLLASNSGEELVYDNYAKQIGVSSPTIKEWVSSLAKTGIIWLVKPYNDRSIAKRIVKRPKMYFFDTGLACYEAGIRDAESLSRSFMKGRFVETYMANEIRKSYMNNGIDQPIYYYRDSQQNEVDLVIPKNGVLKLIECKSGSKFSASDIKSFSCFDSTDLIRETDAVICTTDSAYSISSNAIALPVSSI